jgi:hypothetical protein
VTAKNLQTAALTVSTLFVPIAFAEERWLSQSKFSFIAFVVALYACVLIALISTLIRFRREQRDSLPSWRRTPYALGLAILLALCSSPLATWLLALSKTHDPDYLFFCLFGANVTAAVLLWFGSGWSRLGLTVVAFWILVL